jgi:CdiI N-terminal domain
MNFSIKLTERAFVDGKESFIISEIQIGEFHEIFTSSLSYWSKINYLNQWKVALTRICDGNDKSCFVTSMFDPSSANFIFLWVLYLDGDIVHLQNQILFLEQLNQPFSERNLYEFISIREIISDEGDKISEWDVNINDIREYLNTVCW